MVWRSCRPRQRALNAAIKRVKMRCQPTFIADKGTVREVTLCRHQTSWWVSKVQERLKDAFLCSERLSRVKRYRRQLASNCVGRGKNAVVPLRGGVMAFDLCLPISPRLVRLKRAWRNVKGLPRAIAAVNSGAAHLRGTGRRALHANR